MFRGGGGGDGYLRKGYVFLTFCSGGNRGGSGGLLDPPPFYISYGNEIIWSR